MNIIKTWIAALMVAAGFVSANAEVIAYWPFGENGLNDVSGNGHHLEADAHVNVENVDNCATLDGAQSLFSTIDALDLNPHQEITVEFWTKFDKDEALANVSGDSWLIMFLELTPNMNDYAYGFYVDYNEVQSSLMATWRTASGYAMSCPGHLDSFDNGQWHHVAMVMCAGV